MMNQSFVVPSSCWDRDYRDRDRDRDRDIIIVEEENQAAAAAASSKSQSKPNHHHHHHILPTVDYQVAELTWKDGHLGMHAFGVPKLLTKPKEALASLSTSGPPVVPEERCYWDKPLGGGTLESIVNQATTTATVPLLSKSCIGGVGIGSRGEQRLVTSWFDGQTPPWPIPQSLPVNAAMSCGLVGSCSATPISLMEEGNQSSHDDGRNSRVEQSIRSSCEREVSVSVSDTGGGFTPIYTSCASPGNTTTTTSSAKNTVDHHDSVSHSRIQGGGGDKERVTVLGKRSRCAAVHNQSERKRRDKINQRMSTLQKLVPNSSKTDKASMLDQVIEYMKQLQNKVEMMCRINNNMSTIMLPLAALPPPIMGSINMGGGPMGLNLMDINHHPMTRPGMPQGFYPNPFMPTTLMASSDHNMPQSTASIMPTSDPSFSAASFLASQSQASMTLDAYSRMAAMYHQLQVPESAAAATAPPPASL